MALLYAVKQYDKLKPFRFTTYLDYAIKNTLRSLLNGKTDVLNQKNTESLDQPLGADSDNNEFTLSDTVPDERAAQQYDAVDSLPYIQNTEQAIADKNQRLYQMGAALSEAGVDVNALSDEEKRLQQQTQELAEQQERAAGEAAQFGSKSASAFELAGTAIVTAGISKALSEIYDAYKECVNISMDFGGTMSTVEALSGANSEEMAALSAEARALGASTKFTANESAQAMTYMGMAGCVTISTTAPERLKECPRYNWTTLRAMSPCLTPQRTA